eukprot:IDg9889t1
MFICGGWGIQKIVLELWFDIEAAGGSVFMHKAREQLLITPSTSSQHQGDMEEHRLDIDDPPLQEGSAYPQATPDLQATALTSSLITSPYRASIHRVWRSSMHGR